MQELYELLEGVPTFALGVGASLLAGVSPALGALPVLALERPSRRLQDSLLGFAAGVMLGATAFALALPGVERASEQMQSEGLGVLVVAVGIVAGSLLLWLAHRLLPHQHFAGDRAGPVSLEVSQAWLVVLAIALHNFPEGLAVGVGYGGRDLANGLMVTCGIVLQNLPEGLIVAASLLALGHSKLRAIAVTLLTGLVETAGGIVGAALVSMAEFVLPWALAVAAGAMLFVISDEIIPQTHRGGHETEATFGVVLGFVCVLFLDVLFE